MIECAQKHIVNFHADISSEARSLSIGLILHLQPYFVSESFEGSGESDMRVAKAQVNLHICPGHSLIYMYWLKYLGAARLEDLQNRQPTTSEFSKKNAGDVMVLIAKTQACLCIHVDCPHQLSFSLPMTKTTNNI